jgi:hypothetical protein
MKSKTLEVKTVFYSMEVLERVESWMRIVPKCSGVDTKVLGLRWKCVQQRQAIALRIHQMKQMIPRLVSSPFLDAWDKNAALEAAESELVELYDFIIQSSPSDDSSLKKELGIDSNNHLQLHASETAANSMSSFIEFAAAEKARLSDITNSFLPQKKLVMMSMMGSVLMSPPKL